MQGIKTKTNASRSVCNVMIYNSFYAKKKTEIANAISFPDTA